MASFAEQAWLMDVRGGSVTEFFAELGVELGNTSGQEASIRCFSNPDAHQHEDRVKSCSVNLATGLWNCHGCGQRGNAYQAALACGRSELDASRLAKGHGLFIERERAKPKLPGERQLKRWRTALHGSPVLLARLADVKGWTPQGLWRTSVGWDGERLVFPVRTAKLRVAGAVRYLPGGTPKTLAMPGTKRGMFPAPEVIGKARALFVVEGEPDAVSLWSVGVQAVGIPGAQSWRPEWAGRLAGRRLVVVCDCDAPGRDLAMQIGGMLPKACVVDLEPGRSDGYDLGDFVLEAIIDGGPAQAARVLGELG